MRICSVAFASLLLFTLSSFGQRADYVIKKISPAVITSPVISYNLGPQHPYGRSQQWLEVEVNFQSYVDWTDEVTVRYYILLDAKCLTGEVTHVNVPRALDLYSVMYVSPRTLQRALNGKQLTGSDIVDVGVQLINKGQVLTTKSFKAQGAQQWWQNLQQVTGLVLNKNQTPFSALIWDRYEEIKIPTANQ